MKFMKSGQKGFTLIELLVVVAILGTLAGVVVLNVIQFIGRGACEAAKTEYHNVVTAAVASEYENVVNNVGGTWEDYVQGSTKYTWTSVGTGGATCGDCPTDCTSAPWN